MKRAAHAHLAFDAQGPFHHFREALGDGQAQSRAAVSARALAADLGERLEDPIQFARRNPDARIGHLQQQVHLALIGFAGSGWPPKSGWFPGP